MSDLDKIKREKVRRLARSDFEMFFRINPPRPRYIYGRHTVATLRIMDAVVKSVRAGQSRYVVINMPFRHGKSDIVSRRLAPFLFCSQPEGAGAIEVIEATYNFDLSAGMSYDARACLEKIGPEFGVLLSENRQRIGSWYTTRGDALHAAGLGGTIIGRGADYLIIDDYHKNIQEAESQLIRDRVRESFKIDLMTRRAPVHAVIIVAQRWHPDDLCGWIEKVNDPESDLYDPDFPVFDIYKFPALGPEGWLFPERFPVSWYQSARAMMSAQAWDALGQQDPAPRSGNFFRPEKVVVLPPDEFDRAAAAAGGEWIRGWDVASTQAEIDSDDPDYSVGLLGKYATGKAFVKDVVRGQWDAVRRDQMMLQCAIEDGAGVVVRIESVAGYKDTFTRMENRLAGYAVVQKVTPDKDKVARASVLQAPMEAGCFILRRADWNKAFMDELATFPKKGKGVKLDQVDAAVIAMHDEIVNAVAQFGLSIL